jgi:hypothetical protein
MGHAINKNQASVRICASNAQLNRATMELRRHLNFSTAIQWGIERSTLQKTTEGSSDQPLDWSQLARTPPRAVNS